MSIINPDNPLKSNGGSNYIPDLSSVVTMKTVKATLNNLLWNESNQQTVSIYFVSSNDNKQLIIVRPKRSSRALFDSCGIECVDQENGALVFECKSIPEEDVVVNVFIFDGPKAPSEDFVWWSPKMTSDNTPAPYVAYASSVYTQNNQYYPAYLCFDGVPSTDGYNTGGAWVSGEGNANDKYVQIDCGSKIVVQGFKINPAYTIYGLSTPNRLYIAASNDGYNWTDILIRNDIVWAEISKYNEFSLTNPVEYRYYRFGARNVVSGESWIGRVSFGDIQFLKQND